MKKNYVLGIAALSAVVLLAGCGSKELTPTEYCEQNGGVSQEGLCMFADGSYCSEESYANEECKQGEVMYNVIDEVVEPEVVEEEVVEEIAEPEAVAEEVVEEAAEPEAVVEEVVEEAAE